MTGNDKQIDVLIRRHAQSASRVMVAEHLDADEMSAFAEGQLPPAARAQYVSHLADCDQCRRTVSQLAISGGAIRAEPVVEKTDRSLWQTLAGLFAIPALRYTAFAAVVLIVGAVGYIALRSTSERPANLVARNEATEDQPASAVKPNQPAERGKLAEASKDVSDRQTDKSQPAAPEAKEAKRFDEAKPTDIATADAFKDTPATTVEMKKEAKPSVVTAAPAYAPAPPGEAQTASRAGTVGGVGTFSGPRKGDTSEKLAVNERERDAAKEQARSEEENRVALNKISPARRESDVKQKGPSRNLENSQMNQQVNQNQAEGRAQAPKATGDDRSSSDEPATRSVGGHKFKRQGTAWVDEKYKSSMSLRTVARGSDEFKELDSDLRAIAQQLGGQIIVVWKGKAYFIR